MQVMACFNLAIYSLVNLHFSSYKFNIFDKVIHILVK